ncbi:UDP-galactose-lipid carrier transferase [Cytobacillus spongiae]|jgi:polyphosphate kinase 2 (PPK2 family)|uniref:polyphosphate kinase 2 family protein n=1 Tax=Cytobacillus spongiae TaxID=2901381 RepID=UPI001F17261E|nr:UDP-galactose-lipid carrier transferase [Cytobacillus spongiae]UII57105.1 UDP-galactose-lipid carrier transferase [Cytobacillus spongiae]
MLDTVDLSVKMVSKKVYKKQLKSYQFKLLTLQRLLAKNHLGCVLIFEGWDAAGKGGAIKRLTERLDPRGFEVHATAAPTADEKKYHYLHRFWMRIPKYGKIGIFDRSWYGRVLVERVEDFATEAEWSKAYEEINHFEQILANENYIVLKFWFHISKEEQLRRFNERQSDPLKQWKITNEDWRNREKWDDYEQAVEDMLEKTDRDEAKWTIIEGEDKKYARIKVIKSVIEALEEECRKRDIKVEYVVKST